MPGWGPMASRMIPKADISDTRNPEGVREHVQSNPGSSVLVVEDDPAFLFILSEALREEGFEVLSATNGAEALALYRANADKVSLVVVDVVLPGMDGLTTATEMRKIDENVFFLFMSGYGLQGIEEIGVNIEDIPNADFFQKPFAFKDMLGRIRILVSPHQT